MEYTSLENILARRNSIQNGVPYFLLIFTGEIQCSVSLPTHFNSHEYFNYNLYSINNSLRYATVFHFD